KSSRSPTLKKKTIYVLAQTNTPRAQQLLEQVARGQGNPDLQLIAITYMSERRRQGNAQSLAGMYGSSNDSSVKRRILSSLRDARDKDRLLQIAKTEKTQELRMEAIRALSDTPGTQAEVWQLYQAETTPEIRIQILQSLPQ